MADNEGMAVQGNIAGGLSSMDYIYSESSELKNTSIDAHVYGTGDVDGHENVNSGADASGSAPDGSYPVSLKSYPESVAQEAGPNTKYEENTSDAGIENTVAYSSGETRNIDIEVKNFMLSQNGSASGEGGVAASQHGDDSKEPLLSPEEERLWNIVKTNSLDFNAWTALIEETEKASEDNIVKIRKVYDAFMLEFPLCYGYWKKYADHEARFGSTEKVVEVYERAVQGVTYSVDIWLHYCTFTINTFGDQETARSI